MHSSAEEMITLLAGLPWTPPLIGEDSILALEHVGLSCMVGRTGAGCVCVLVPTVGRAPGRHHRLRNIEVREGVNCDVLAPGGPTRTIKGTLVVCRSEEAGIVRLFLSLLADAMTMLGPSPAASEFSSWVVCAAELFSRLEGEGRRTMQGLWAELVIASSLPSPEVAVRRWHADPLDRYDFTSGAFSLEVKSCTDCDRVHSFSLDQLRPQTGALVWIASVVAKPEPLGRSVLELVHALEERIPTLNVRNKLREIVFASAGSSINDDDRYRFDEAGARASLRLLDACAVPSVSGPLAPEILGIQLKVRCVDLPAVGDLVEAGAKLL